MSRRPKARHGEPRKWIDSLLTEIDDGLCRDWPFGLGGQGYAYLGRKHAAHIVLELTDRPQPEPPNNCSLHWCDRPICVAPWHLRWGTQADNMTDMALRGRSPSGERHWNSHLANDQRSEIRRLYGLGSVSQRQLGERFGVRQSTISLIVNSEGPA